MDVKMLSPARHYASMVLTMTLCLCLSQASIVSRRLCTIVGLWRILALLNLETNKSLILKNKMAVGWCPYISTVDIRKATQPQQGTWRVQCGCWWGCILLPPGEYDWTVRVRQRWLLRHITLTTSYLCHYHTSCWVNAVLNGVSVRDLWIVFLRSNRISNRIGRPIRFRIEFSNRIGRIYHASRNTV